MSLRVLISIRPLRDGAPQVVDFVARSYNAAQPTAGCVEDGQSCPSNRETTQLPASGGVPSGGTDRIVRPPHRMCAWDVRYATFSHRHSSGSVGRLPYDRMPT